MKKSMKKPRKSLKKTPKISEKTLKIDEKNRQNYGLDKKSINHHHCSKFWILLASQPCIKRAKPDLEAFIFVGFG